MLTVIAAAMSCSTLIYSPLSTTPIHSAPRGSIVGTIRQGTAVTIDTTSGDWLHLRAPKLGWVPTSATFVNCGSSSNMQDIRNLRSLAIQARDDRLAMNTFVRFAADNGGKHEGMMQEEDAVDDLVDVMNVAPQQVADTLDQLTDQDRKKLLASAIDRGDDVDQAAPAFIHFIAVQPWRPTAVSWRAILKQRAEMGP